MTTREPSPYKFLDPFEPEDRDRFFGRDREIKILLADIVTTRLVVLFAKTGTGKTSLINAGVRPLLHERGYVTFFIRVGGDPVRSAREVIASELERDPATRHVRTGIATEAFATLADVPFPEALTTLAEDLVPPSSRASTLREDGNADEPEQRVRLVLFFDQFEEFFLSVGRTDARSAREFVSEEGRADAKSARAFVSEVARLYEDAESGVHLVFSMREEFLAEMDIFRDEIPEIFHADSNLRLRWFTPEQAKAAIRGPVDGAIEPELTRTLLEQLAKIGRTDAGVSPETPIEPAQLQIVCDTIWRARDGSRMDVATYGRLGGAAAILESRLVEELGKLADKEQVDLVGRLLPELTTDPGTKAVREVAELARSLGTDDETLSSLLGELERSGLVNVIPRDQTRFVEFVHDYLAEPKRVEALRRNLRLVRPRRALAQASAERRLLSGAELDEVREALDVLTLDAKAGALLLRSALRNGLSGFDAGRVLRRAEASGVRAWPVLHEALAGGDEEGVVEAVAGRGSPEALAVLEAALDRPVVAARAAQLLGESGAPEAVDILSPKLHDPALAASAELALVRLSRSRVPGDGPARAAQRLASFSHEQSLGRERVQVEERRAPTPPALTEEVLARIADAFLDGMIVPFLGSGIAAFARPRGMQWQPGSFPPSGFELAEHLAGVFFYPEEHPPGDLLRVAQYVATIQGLGPLYRELRRVFAADYPPTQLHRFLADVPRRRRDGATRGTGGQLIVTTNYDDALERALDDVQEPYDVLWYVAEGEDRGSFWHRPYDDAPRKITRPNRYDELSLDDRSVILKLHGSVDRETSDRDSFVITEDHHIDYFMATDISLLLPPAVLYQVRASHALFLGYGVVDWSQRVVLRRMWGDQRLGYASWAIRAGFASLELEEWRARGVDVYDAPLEHVVSELARRVEDRFDNGRQEGRT